MFTEFGMVLSVDDMEKKWPGSPIRKVQIGELLKKDKTKHHISYERNAWEY